MRRILRGFWHFESRQNSPNLAPKLRFQPRCRQVARWSEVTFSGTAPTARSDHAAVWSEAANGMYIFGGWGDSGSPVLGAAAGQRWRAPRPKQRRSCAEATSTTCISSIARPPERTEVGEASKQFLLGFARLWGLNFLKTGDISKICRHQPHLGSYFLCPQFCHFVVSHQNLGCFGMHGWFLVLIHSVETRFSYPLCSVETGCSSHIC